MNDLNRAIEELKNGNYSEGMVILLDILKKDPKNVNVLYNLGMCYSEMGLYTKSIEVLENCISLDSTNSNIFVALGFSYHKHGSNDKALSAFLKALEIEPDNFYALKNIGGTYANMGELGKAISCFEKANDILPNTPEVLIGLAKALEQNSSLTRASDIYKTILELKSTYEIEKLAEEGLTRIAMADLKAKGYRVDAVMYCLSAIEMFSKMSNEKIKEISFEIAILGTKGLSINDPEKQYKLKSLEGNFSGLQLVSYMFVGFKIIDKNLPPAADLEMEYEAALQLYRSRLNK